MADRLREFKRINPPIFIGSKTSEDPQEFVDEVHKILVAMRQHIFRVGFLPAQGCFIDLVQDVARYSCLRWSASHLGAVQDNIC